MSEEIKTITVENGNQYINVTLKEDGDISEKEENLEGGQSITSQQPLSRVKVGGSITHNTGNYCSVKVEVGIEIPSKTTERSLQKTYLYASEWVSKRIDEELLIALKEKPKNISEGLDEDITF